MKKLISLTLAALLLLNLAACGESSVSTEAEVRALYGDDASLITSIEAYQ